MFGYKKKYYELRERVQELERNALVIKRNKILKTCNKLIGKKVVINVCGGFWNGGFNTYAKLLQVESINNNVSLIIKIKDTIQTMVFDSKKEFSVKKYKKEKL